jgi:hypothetical protein
LPEAEPSPRTLAVLRDAETYFTSQLAGSWAPGNLADRRISEATARDWHIEKSPGWGVHAAMVGGRAPARVKQALPADRGSGAAGPLTG